MEKRENWKSAVLKAQWAFQHRNKFCYIYGAKGQKITSREIFERLWNAEPEYFKKYTPEEKEEIFRNSYGKFAYDCSGFVSYFCYPTLKTYSTGLYNQRAKEHEDWMKSTAGSMLYTTFKGTGRHIGIDGGNGYFFDMGVESTNKNVQAGIDSVRCRPFSIFPNYWEHCFEHKDVDYSFTTNYSIENITTAIL